MRRATLTILDPPSARFPVFVALEISDYALYRPSPGEETFVWKFEAGPNALIGVNGLGKSTLVSMLFRLLTGPFDLNRRALEGELGQPDTDPVLIGDRRMFARRVADQAATAEARLTFQVGTKLIVIKRRLSDLSLVEFTIDGEGEPTSDDDRVLYQTRLADLMGVGSFFDVLIILRFLVFVFEDRRSLVWDDSAQRQIFRAVMTPPNASRRSLEIQRTIVEADSSARNIRVQVNKARRQLDSTIVQAQARDSSLAQLFVTEQEVQALQERRATVVRELEDLDTDRIQERRARMRAEHERDRLLGEIDGAKLRLIGHLFSEVPPAARLAMNRATESGQCSCCGQSAPGLVARVEKALREMCCPYCEQPLPEELRVPYEVLDQARIEKLEASYNQASVQAEAAATRIQTIEDRIQARRRDLQQIERDVNHASNRYAHFRRSVAIEPDEIMRRRVSVDALTDIMNEALERQRAAENSLQALVEELEENVRKQQDTISLLFDRFAGTFMHEECHLTYISRDDRIGQEGLRFRFPSFQVALSGGAVAGQTLRDNPGAVSLSQREFIDIAFRMALLNAAASTPGSSLVIDTPEAGLDFLFAERAGLQFLEFAPVGGENSIIITSNLVSDHLLKAILKDSVGATERRARLLNLIDHAAPTAAIREDHVRYNAFVEDIVNG